MGLLVAETIAASDRLVRLHLDWHRCLDGQTTSEPCSDAQNAQHSVFSAVLDRWRPYGI